MMDNLRAASNSVVLKVILALIMLSFVLTGVGSYLVGGSNSYVAEVNGQEIDRARFEQSVMNERARLQQQLGEQFSQLAGNEAYVKQMRQQVLNRMINDLLLDQYAAKIGMAIGDDQVKVSIQSSPEFATDGKFDNSKYRDLLNRFQIAPEQYAEMTRKQLLSQQLLAAFAGTNFSLPVETESVVALIQQQRDIRVASIDMKALEAKAEVTPTAEQVKAFYDQNKSRFTAPEMARVKYIEVDAAKLTDDIKVSDQEVADFYAKNKPLYIQAPRSSYSIIVLSKESDAKDVLAQLKSGGDFAALAKEKSLEKDSGAKGGDLGWLEAAAVPDDIAKAKLTEKGQLSDVIHSDMGYLVVRLNDIQAAKEKPLEDVKAEITKNLLQDKSYNKFEDIQTKLMDGAASNNLSLDAAEKSSGLKAVESGWLSRDNMPKELSYPEVVQEIFGGDLFGVKGAPGPNSDLITVEGDRAFVLRIVEHRPEAVQPFEEVSADITELLKRQNVTKMAREQADQLVAALKTDKGDEALQAAKVKFGDKKVITRMSDDAQLAESVFALPLPKDGKPSYGVSSDKNDNIVLVALDAVHPGQMDAASLKAFSAQMANQDSGVVLDALISNLRQQAKIKMGDLANVQ
ncbi:peptidylprolyl isomerase [Budviciaceae bacterium CWB-B4]|uniref:Periplasmic chaperone PpiD n=1 Tax=Limnobaculum xujianqingii TaxID=2738837 RepID=A0A9D7FUI1_9GAMM|nr:peptidylprolyl isomerase [Limnobaculum xujianqingii]MBK5073999.1 peptidylprolyl isomerase [Limnobaculum xujianqingii]MBK5177107.1 peptidylprolyl isomerase [Limnobaculum xujianqingii]